MVTLSKADFQGAREALMRVGRPLEQALFRHEFEGARADEAVAELARYQNVDGGFGHGLEPDAQTPAWSGLHTALGLRFLHQVGRGADDPRVAGAVRYLRDSFDPASKVWAIMPPEVNEAPHAPWWHREGDSLEQTFGGFRLNPRAAILAQLWHYAELVSGAWLADVTADTVRAYAQQPADWQDLLCVVELVDEPALPDQYRAPLAARARALAADLVKTDPAAWPEYGGQPLVAVPRPDSLLADDYRAALEENLDYLIAQQQPDGSWPPNWSWGDSYPAAWETARRAWIGYLILENLRTLRAYGRIES